jgi:3-oxoacyl-[acyl-carrier protein] reductase
MQLNEQLVLVSGGGRGLGSAIVRAFAREGAQVAINYHHSEAAAHTLAAELGEGVAAFRADVSQRAEVEQLVAAISQRFGKAPEVIVHNALAAYQFNGDGRDSAEDITWSAFERQLAVTLQGGIHLMQTAFPAMRERGYGRVVHVGTNLFQNPVVPYHDYTAAKAALLSLTRTFSKDFGPHGITVNMVSGGLLRTTDASAATPAAVFELIAGQTPLRSVTTPAEFADAVLFFASPWSRAITGQNLVVDGGLVCD